MEPLPLTALRAPAEELTATRALRLLAEAERQLYSCLDQAAPCFEAEPRLRVALFQHYHSQYSLGQPRIQLSVVADPAHVPVVRHSSWCHVMCWALSAAYMVQHEWQGRTLRTLPPSELEKLSKLTEHSVDEWGACLCVLLDRGQSSVVPHLPVQWEDLQTARLEWQRLLTELRAGQRRADTLEHILAWFRRHVIFGAWAGLQRCFWARCAAAWLTHQPATELAGLVPGLERLTHWHTYLTLYWSLLSRAGLAPWEALLAPGENCTARAFRTYLWGDDTAEPRISDRLREGLLEICAAQNLTGCSEENYRTVFSQPRSAVVRASAILQKLGGAGRREAFRHLTERVSPDPGVVCRLGRADQLSSQDPLDELDLALLDERMSVLRKRGVLGAGLVLLPTSALRWLEPGRTPEGPQVLPDTCRPRPVLLSAFGGWLCYDLEEQKEPVVLCASLPEGWAWWCWTLQRRYRGRLQDGSFLLHGTGFPLLDWLQKLRTTAAPVA